MASPWALGAVTSWSALFNSADMASMTVSYSVLSSVAGIANGTNLDKFMSVSAVLACASAAIGAGDNITLWAAGLQADGTTYGDGLLTAGTPANLTPGWSPVATIPLYASTRTTIIGSMDGILIPPRTIKFIMQPNIAAAAGLGSGTQTFDYFTYNP